MAASWTVPLLLLLLVSVETRPSPPDDGQQALISLFGSRLSSLIEATPTPNDITEGSGSTPPSSGGNASRVAAGREGAVPKLLLDFLRRRVKTRRRSHKPAAAAWGRGCFGMKLDRIGSISGLGC